MAGRSQRFVDAGVNEPKWSLRIGAKSILGWAVESVLPMMREGWRLHVVALEEHVASRCFSEAVEDLGVPFDVTTVGSSPHGQALSALAASESVSSGVPIAVWNADTHVSSGPSFFNPSGGNWLTVAHLPGEHWSFAEVDDRGVVTRTAEKRRISPWASVGLYGFADMGVLRSAVARANQQRGEVYIAPLYNALIEEGTPVDSFVVAADRVIAMGSPEEVVASCRAMHIPIPAELQGYAESHPERDCPGSGVTGAGSGR
jgi:hypothetical protein